MIKALIFDMDNTIIDRQRAFKEGIRTILHHYFTDEELIDIMVEDIIVWDNKGMVERIDVFNMFVEKYNIDYPTATQLDKDWKKMSGKTCYMFADVRDTLVKLKKKYKLAILSNGQKETQRRKLNHIDIYNLLDYSLISSEYICWKPDPRIFQYTCEQMGCKPKECAYIGDNYEVDVLGSFKAGLKPVFVNRTKEHRPKVITINQINELLDIF